MRKQTGIALFAVVTVGVLLFAVAQRQEDSIEWHKQEYVKARTRRTWSDQIHQLWGEVAGKPYDPRERHRQALIRLGYLEERTFIVSNRPPSLIAGTVRNECAGLTYMYGDPTAQGMDRVRIIGVKEEMSQWESLIRRYDTPTWEELMRRFDEP